jgi:hypothetical protein
MHKFTQTTLVANGVVLLFICLWLLVGGSRGYYGNGAAGEVDGIVLLVLTLFNVSFLALASFSAPPAGGPEADAWRAVRCRGSKLGFQLNVGLLLVVALWLLINDGRRQYWVSNATEVDLVLLLVLAGWNVTYMGVAWLAAAPRPQPKEARLP